MRADMFKVVVERPRTGGDGGKSIPGKGYKKQWDKIPLDELPKREGIAKPYIKNYHGGKSLNEHLNPLYKYLMKQVGRPWDKVFSEICENISQNSAVQSHVRDHALDYVERNVVMVGKVPTIEAGRYWGWTPSELLYVHPVNGLLCYYKAKRRKRPKEKSPLVVIDGATYFKHDDIWYEITLAAFPVMGIWSPILRMPLKKPMPAYDVVFKRTIAPSDTGKLYGLWGSRSNHAVSKRQLNSREIKKLGLRSKI